MKRDDFKNALARTGGQFVFYTDTHEGMIGITPSRIVIWVDYLGFSKIANEDDEEEQPK